LFFPEWKPSPSEIYGFATGWKPTQSKNSYLPVILTDSSCLKTERPTGSNLVTADDDVNNDDRFQLLYASWIILIRSAHKIPQESQETKVDTIL
jgi:hypothetical protein